MENRTDGHIFIPEVNSDAVEGAVPGAFGTLYYTRNKRSFTLSYDSPDDNIGALRERYPAGLHFVVGDTHGEAKTLMDLMAKIRFDPAKDHVYFVGDYNAGGNVHTLLRYMSNYYQPDPEEPGFHMIRGNHERELSPVYTLENLPDLYVIRGEYLNYYVAHAGMVESAFRLIGTDLDAHPGQRVFQYGLSDRSVGYNASLRQITWSMRGLYSQHSRYAPPRDGENRSPDMGRWPETAELRQRRACIIHGHSPFSFFCRPGYYSYGSRKLFYTRQHVFFSEALQSFNIDSDVKGRCENGQTYRGLSCVCLEVLEEIAAENGSLTLEGVVNAQNAVFAVPYVPCWGMDTPGDIGRILNAAPQMRRITLDAKGQPCFADQSEA